MGALIRREKGTIMLFTVMIVILLGYDYGFSIDGVSTFITDTKDFIVGIKNFNIKDAGIGMAKLVIDTTANGIIAIWGFMTKNIYSSDFNTGMNAMLDAVGFNSVKGLIGSIASSIKSLI